MIVNITPEVATLYVDSCHYGSVVVRTKFTLVINEGDLKAKIDMALDDAQIIKHNTTNRLVPDYEASVRVALYELLKGLVNDEQP
ncbi:hypothetical protein EJP82_01355 [Paenibacillus anaericanus]|uniref:Uncharacterized protein n=1 Tax=Paenibacillus anaericanus TaxID=170367 RepID=A0A3S1EM96_9BACL|nr:hypothetical protein [Paenibacillus anaericanus]RUT48616.1 hypothetical protein EJP82_01355 [Paenibacillus anaericanus]